MTEQLKVRHLEIIQSGLSLPFRFQHHFLLLPSQSLRELV